MVFFSRWSANFLQLFGRKWRLKMLSQLQFTVFYTYLHTFHRRLSTRGNSLAQIRLKSAFFLQLRHVYMVFPIISVHRVIIKLIMLWLWEVESTALFLTTFDHQKVPSTFYRHGEYLWLFNFPYFAVNYAATLVADSRLEGIVFMVMYHFDETFFSKFSHCFATLF